MFGDYKQAGSRSKSDYARNQQHYRQRLPSQPDSQSTKKFRVASTRAIMFPKMFASLPEFKKAAIVAALSALSLALGVSMFLYQGGVSSDTAIVRSAFILISMLMVPHFILEHILTKKRAA